MGAMKEEARVSRAMLSKLSKQQHLLLRELERTKRRLREEIHAREETRLIPPTASDTIAWTNQWIGNVDASRDTLPATGVCVGTKRSPIKNVVGGGRGPGNASLKRSRSEAGIGYVESGAEGIETARVPKREVARPSPTTRIDMLPVMASTGEAALEVGISSFPAGRGWTAEPCAGQGKAVHMLPVFRLPEVSNNPAGGFLGRLPRQETQRERDLRLNETEEIEKMKKALGLTDRELEALEQELLKSREREGKYPVVPPRSNQNIFNDPNAAGLGTQEHITSFSSSGKRRRHLTDERQGGKGTSRGRRRRRGEARLRGRNTSSMAPTLDGNIVDLPTPRVLRRAPHSTLAAELAASAALSIRSTGSRKTLGAWASIGDVGIGTTAGPMLGATATTGDILAAAADVGMANLLELRRELGRSVSQVRTLARAVKADVQDVTRICPVQHPRAVRFLRRWACERLATLANEIIFSRAAAALERWRHAVAATAMAERKDAYFRYQATRKLGFTIDKAYLRRLAKGWIRWASLVEIKRAEERRALEISTATTIQRVVRGWAARRLRARLTLIAQDRERHEAAVAITRYTKGKVARLRFRRLKGDVERVRAGEILRRVGRGMLGRKKATRLREDLARYKVALLLQTRYRGRAGRRLFLAIMEARRERLAATRIQAVTRGKWGRKRAVRVNQESCDDAAAGLILRAARAWLARRLVQRTREEELRSRAIRATAALNIQRVYRGHRSRILHGTRLEIMKSLQRSEIAAAIKIQALVRAHLSKRVIAKLSRVRKEKRVSDARLWTETWSEDAQAWFYYNALTGEALWQPPSTGYAKHDGKLVLISGEVVEDPLQGLTDEEQIEAKKQSSCVECENKRATRTCEQCGDGYCTRCFRKTHASGRRAKHTWAHVGPMECAECEAEVAIKWCTACDDPFCGPCWTAIHSRGKRSFHSHCTISPGGRISTKAIAADGSTVGPFTPGESLIAETAGGGGGGGGYESAAAEQGYGVTAAAAPLAEVQTADSEWQGYSDDSGYPYWYNSVSGDSQYEDPFAQQSWAGGSIVTGTDSSITYNAAAGDAWDGRQGGEQQWDTTQQGQSAYFGDPNSGIVVAATESSGEWSEHVDDEGHTYYYSSLKGESQYEYPYS